MSATTDEELRLLSDLVPLLAKKVTDARQAAEALETATTQFQHEADEAQLDAASRLTELQAALPNLVTQVEGAKTALETAGTAMIGAWHEAEPRLATSGEEMLKQAAAVIPHAHDLQAALAEAGTRIDQLQAIGDAALAKLAQHCQEAEQRLQTALQALEKEVQQLTQSAEAAAEALATAAGSFNSALANAAERAEMAVEGGLEEMGNKANAHKGAAEPLFASLAGKLMGKVDATDGDIQQAVNTPLTQMETDLERNLEKVGITADIWGKELEQHGQRLDQALEEVKGQEAAVPKGIAEIIDAATRLGL